MSKQDDVESLLQQLHFIISHVTRDLTIPSDKEAEQVRKKMAVFTYGVAAALASKTSVKAEELYFHYLSKSGLSDHQAKVMVERTCFLHAENNFGSACLQAGKEAVSALDENDINYEFNIKELLF